MRPYVILQFYCVIISVDLIPGSFKLSGWDNSISVPAKLATSQTQSRSSASIQSLVFFKNVFLIILAYFDNFLLIKLLQVDSSYQEPRSKTSLTDNPDNSAFEVEADLVEWPPKSKFSVTPDNTRVFFNQREIVELHTSLWGWIKLNENWFFPSLYTFVLSR